MIRLKQQILVINLFAASIEVAAFSFHSNKLKYKDAKNMPKKFRYENLVR